MTNDEWEQRLVQAATLQEQGLSCSACAGTGGWPGIGGWHRMGGWVPCKACEETGLGASAGAAQDSTAP